MYNDKTYVAQKGIILKVIDLLLIPIISCTNSINTDTDTNTNIDTLPSYLGVGQFSNS